MIIKSTRNSVIAAVIFSVLSGASTLGTANIGAVEVKSVHVSYADLNLAEKAGQQTLYERLKGAAEDVCGETRGIELSQVRRQRQCYKEALDNAIGQVGSKGLESIHEG
jgi:UrcA family protein